MTKENLPKSKKTRKSIVFIILVLLIFVVISTYFCLRFKGLDSTIAGGLLAGLVVGLINMSLRWIEEGK